MAAYRTGFKLFRPVVTKVRTICNSLYHPKDKNKPVNKQPVYAVYPTLFLGGNVRVSASRRRLSSKAADLLQRNRKAQQAQWLTANEKENAKEEVVVDPKDLPPPQLPDIKEPLDPSIKVVHIQREVVPPPPKQKVYEHDPNSSMWKVHKDRLRENAGASARSPAPSGADKRRDPVSRCVGVEATFKLNDTEIKASVEQYYKARWEQENRPIKEKKQKNGPAPPPPAKEDTVRTPNSPAHLYKSNTDSTFISSIQAKPLVDKKFRFQRPPPKPGKNTIAIVRYHDGASNEIGTVEDLITKVTPNLSTKFKSSRKVKQTAACVAKSPKLEINAKPKREKRITPVIRETNIKRDAILNASPNLERTTKQRNLLKPQNECRVSKERSVVNKEICEPVQNHTTYSKASPNESKILADSHIKSHKVEDEMGASSEKISFKPIFNFFYPGANPVVEARRGYHCSTRQKAKTSIFGKRFYGENGESRGITGQKGKGDIHTLSSEDKLKYVLKNKKKGDKIGNSDYHSLRKPCAKNTETRDYHSLRKPCAKNTETRDYHSLKPCARNMETRDYHSLRKPCAKNTEDYHSLRKPCAKNTETRDYHSLRKPCAKNMETLAAKLEKKKVQPRQNVHTLVSDNNTKKLLKSRRLAKHSSRKIEHEQNDCTHTNTVRNFSKVPKTPNKYCSVTKGTGKDNFLPRPIHRSEGTGKDNFLPRPIHRNGDKDKKYKTVTRGGKDAFLPRPPRGGKDAFLPRPQDLDFPFDECPKTEYRCADNRVMEYSSNGYSNDCPNISGDDYHTLTQGCRKDEYVIEIESIEKLIRSRRFANLASMKAEKVDPENVDNNGDNCLAEKLRQNKNLVSIDGLDSYSSLNESLFGRYELKTYTKPHSDSAPLCVRKFLGNDRCTSDLDPTARRFLRIPELMRRRSISSCATCHKDKNSLPCETKQPKKGEVKMKVHKVQWGPCEKICMPCCKPTALKCDQPPEYLKSCKKAEYRYPSYSECKKSLASKKKRNECCYEPPRPCPEQAVGSAAHSPFTSVKKRTDRILGRQPPHDPCQQKKFSTLAVKYFSTNALWQSKKKDGECKKAKDELPCVKPMDVLGGVKKDKKSSKKDCEKLCMPCCPPARTPPECYYPFIKPPCKKVKPPRPAYSECKTDIVRQPKPCECEIPRAPPCDKKKSGKGKKCMSTYAAQATEQGEAGNK